MREHEVPTHVQAEDRVLLWFTFPQIVALTAVAALAYGYTTGGDHVGPLSLGWKGGVGDHIGYGVLVALAAVSLTVSLVLVSFRDADAAAHADRSGPLTSPPGPPRDGRPDPVPPDVGRDFRVLLGEEAER